jgi:hypothetical protein
LDSPDIVPGNPGRRTCSLPTQPNVLQNDGGDGGDSSDDYPAHGSTPEGRPFTKHYGTDTGPQRNIPGTVVDETIRKAPGKPAGGGKTVHYDPENNVTVVTGDGGSIVSVHKGPPRAGQR